jgi:hypothetical protein
MAALGTSATRRNLTVTNMARINATHSPDCAALHLASLPRFPLRDEFGLKISKLDTSRKNNLT